MEHKIFVEKYRPSDIKNFIGSPILKETIMDWIDKENFPNLIFYGKPGSGKTTIAKIIVKNINCDYIYINCSDENGIDIVRDKVKSFAGAASFKPLKVVILDEADFLTINAQASLRAIIENYSLTTRFIFTCNFLEKIIEPLQSRLSPYELEQPTRTEIAKHINGILDQEEVKFDLGDVASIINKFYPDIRKIINITQSCIIDGKLVVDEKKFTSTLQLETIVNLMKKDKLSTPSSRNKVFNEIRQIIADNDIKDFTEMYRGLYDSFTQPDHTIVISDHLYQSVTIPDKEVCFMACISKLLQI